MDSDISKVISAEDIAVFERSEPTRQAVKLIGSASAGGLVSLTAKQYVLVRDYLLAKIVLSNANRTGILTNITLKQLQDARDVDDHLVVSVENHKTAWIQGPAKIVLTKTMHSWLQIFVSNIRVHFARDVGDGNGRPVFLTTNGEPMESSQICRALQSVWTKAGLSNKITCTLVRKTAVSTVHQQAPHMSSNLADLNDCERLCCVVL